MAMFGLPGGGELLIILAIFSFYGLLAVGFFTVLYFAIAKGVARGIRDGYASIPMDPEAVAPVSPEASAAAQQAHPADFGTRAADEAR